MAKINSLPLLQQLQAFDGPPRQFLSLFLQLRADLVKAEYSLMFKKDVKGQLSLLNSYPEKLVDADAFINFAQTKTTEISSPSFSLSSLQETGQAVLLHSFKSHSGLIIEAFLLAPESQPDYQLKRDQLSFTQTLIDLYEEKMTLKQRTMAMARSRKSMDILLKVNQAKNFNQLQVSFCDEMSINFSCDRVSLGWVKKNRISLINMTHTEKISKKMRLIQDLESAMEESMDQDTEVIYPPSKNARYLYRAAEHFSRQHDASTLLLIPIRGIKDVVGVLALERAPNKHFTLDDIESCRLSVDLLAPRLVELEEHSHLGKIFYRRFLKKCFEFTFGAKHIAAKLWSITIITLIVLAATLKGTYKVEGSAKVELKTKKDIVVPYEGILDKVHVKPGQRVSKGQRLVDMDTIELQLRKSSLQSELLIARKEQHIAMNKKKNAEAVIAQAKCKKYIAEIALIDNWISKASLNSPFDGYLFAEKDLSQLLHPPVQKGELLFTIGQKKHYLLEVFIPEEKIADIEDAGKGFFATAGRPDEKIAFEIVERSHIAETNNNRNVFKVTAKIAKRPQWLKPGMEGLAKVHLDERLYSWIWTHKAINWLKMKLWL